MRRLTLAALLCCTLVYTCARAGQVTLSKITRIDISPNGPAAEGLALASDLLEKYLRLALRRRDLRGTGETVAFSLDAKALTWYRLSSKELSSLAAIDEFAIKIQTAPKPTVHITGATVLATCYGVMHFLENYLGVTWLFPGELGLALPTQDEFRLPETDVVLRPAFVSRIYTGLLLPDPDQMLPFRTTYQHTELHANRHFFEAYDYFKSLKLHYLTHATHAIVNIYPVRQYAVEHPDVYPLKDGKRHIPPLRKDAAGHYQAWHPCYTNPKVQQIAIEKAKATFARGGHCFSLGINDGLRVQCECEVCRKVGWPEAYYQYVTRVAEAVEEHYPPHMVGVLAYGDVRHPRADLRLPENVLVLVTGARLVKWARHAEHLGTYEYCYGGGYGLPNFPLKAMIRNAAYYREQHAKVYRAEVYPVWAFDAPKVYILSRLLWDPDLDVDAALTRYCNAAFGAGGPAMEQLYRHWASRYDHIVDPESDAATPMVDFREWRNSTAQFARMKPSDYALTVSCLHQARALVNREAESKRLDMAEAFFEYSRTLFEMSRRVPPVFNPEATVDLKKTLIELAGLWETREQLLTKMKEHPEWFAGTVTLEELLSTRYEQSGGWTIRNEANSAIKTALFRLQEQKAAGDALRAELPAFLKPYLTACKRVPVPRFSITKKGQTYYGQHPERFVQLAARARDGTLGCGSVAGNPRIAKGRGQGNYKEQWMQATFVRKPHDGRALFLVKLEATGRRGTLRFAVHNLGYGMGWLGVPTSGTFGDRESTVKREFLVEPLFPNSGYEYSETSHGVRIQWMPEADDASFISSCTLTQINFERGKDEKTMPELPELGLDDADEELDEE